MAPFCRWSWSTSHVSGFRDDVELLRVALAEGEELIGKLTPTYANPEIDLSNSTLALAHQWTTTPPAGALSPWCSTALATIVWLVLGLAQYGYEVGSGTDNDYTVFVLFPFSTIAWIDKIATAPALGAFLLVFGIEAAHATTAIKKLQEAARTKTLTRHLYVAARKRIRERMVGWRLGVGILACVALYNTIGLFVILERPGLDPTFKHRNEEQVQHAVCSARRWCCPPSSR